MAKDDSDFMRQFFPGLPTNQVGGVVGMQNERIGADHLPGVNSPGKKLFMNPDGSTVLMQSGMGTGRYRTIYTPGNRESRNLSPFWPLTERDYAEREAYVLFSEFTDDATPCYPYEPIKRFIMLDRHGYEVDFQLDDVSTRPP